MTAVLLIIVSPAALSAANIEAKLNLVKDAIPDSVYEHPDLEIPDERRSC